MPPAIGALAAGASGLLAGASIGAIAASIGTSLLGSLVSQAFAAGAGDKRNAGPPSAAQTLNFTDPSAPHNLVRGQMRYAGARTYFETNNGYQLVGAGTNNFVLVYTVSARPVTSFDGFFFNDTFVPVDAQNNVHQGPGNPDGTNNFNFAGFASVFWSRGTYQDDLAFVTLMKQFSVNWQGGQYGRAKIAVVLSMSAGSPFAAVGLPNVGAMVRGSPVYDPRVSGTAIVSSTAASPAVYTTSGAHGRSPGDLVWLSGHSGAVATGLSDGDPNGRMMEILAVPSPTSFTLVGPGSTWSSAGGVASVGLIQTAGGTGGTVTPMVWTDNAALHVNDLLCDGVYGPGAKFDADIPSEALIAAANACDEMVTRNVAATTFTADPSTGLITFSELDTNNNPFSPPNYAAVVLATTGSLPAPLTAGTVYFLEFAAGNTAYLHATVASAVAKTSRIAFTSAGSGTQTMSLATTFTASPGSTSLIAAQVSGSALGSSIAGAIVQGTLPNQYTIAAIDTVTGKVTLNLQVVTTSTQQAGRTVVTVTTVTPVTDAPTGTIFTIVSLLASGALPAGLQAKTPYWWASTGKGTGFLCSSLANASQTPPVGVAITSLGPGLANLVLDRVIVSQPRAIYNSALLLSNSNLRILTGTQVQLSTTGTLPAPLSPSSTYYAILLASFTQGQTVGSYIALAATLADARAGNFIALTTAGSGTHAITVLAEPRYTVNGLQDSSTDIQTNIEDLLTACGGYLEPNSLTILPAIYRTPTVDTDESDLRAGIDLQSVTGGQQSFNGVKGTYYDPLESGAPCDFPQWQPPSTLSADGGHRVWKDVQLKHTNSSSMAQRLASIALNRIRREATLQLKCNLTMLQATAGDVVNVTNALLGYSNATFEVQTWQLVKDRAANTNSQSDVPVPGVDLLLRETDSDVFSWSPNQENFKNPQIGSNLPNPYVVAPPTNLSALSGIDTLDAGADAPGVSRLVVTWTAPNDPFVSTGGQIEIQYRISGGNYGWVKGPTVAGDSTLAVITDAQNGVTYDIRARSKNQLGLYSDTRDPWQATLYGFTYVGVQQLLQIAPPNVTGIASAFDNSNAGQTILNWNQVTDPEGRSPIGYEVRLGTNWNTAQRIVQTLTPSARVLGDGTYLVCAYYFIPPSGPFVYSATPASISISGSTLTTNVLATYDAASSGWNGTLSGVQIESGDVQLASTGDILGAPDITAIPDILSYGPVVAAGSFTIPSGAIIRSSRVTACNVLITLTSVVAFDTQSVDIITTADVTQVSDVLSLDQTGAANAIPQIQVSQDGGSTWGAWQNWIPGAYVGNAFNARLLLGTTNTQVNVKVADFKFSVDIPTTTQAITNKSLLSGGAAITYPQAFNGGPGDAAGAGLPNVQVDIRNAQEGDRVVRSSESLTGITLQVTNGGVGVARTVDILATGW